MTLKKQKQDYLQVKIRFSASLLGRLNPYFSLNSALLIWKASVSSGKATLWLPGIFPSSFSSLGFLTSTRSAVPSLSRAVSCWKVTTPMAEFTLWDLQEHWGSREKVVGLEQRTRYYNNTYNTHPPLPHTHCKSGARICNLYLQTKDSFKDPALSWRIQAIIFVFLISVISSVM